MAEATSPGAGRRGGAPIGVGAQAPRIPIAVLGLSLGVFFVITFVLCVAADLMFPDLTMYRTWLRLLPGFTWLSWTSFLLGIIESFGYGWYVAVIFCPLFNFFVARIR
jgi:hypothetical protein